MSIRELGNGLGNALALPKATSGGIFEVVNTHSIGINFGVSQTNYINLPFSPANKEALEITFTYAGTNGLPAKKIFIPYIDSPTTSSGYLWIIPNSADRARDQYIEYQPTLNRLACTTGTTANMQGNIVINEYKRKVKNKYKFPATTASTLYPMPFNISNPSKVFIGASIGENGIGYMNGFSDGLNQYSFNIYGYTSSFQALRIFKNGTFDSSTYVNSASQFYIIEFE